MQLDEVAIYDSSTTSDWLKTTFTGVLGDEITEEATDRGVIRLGQVRDVTKRLADLFIEVFDHYEDLPLEELVDPDGPANQLDVLRQALAIVQTMLRDTSDYPWVFPSVEGNGPVTTLQKAVRRIRRDTKLDFRPHDLRRTAASHMTGMGINRLTVAKILNHAEREVTAVYDRHSYDQEKRNALEAWGGRLEKIVTLTQRPTKVVPLRQG